MTFCFLILKNRQVGCSCRHSCRCRRSAHRGEWRVKVRSSAPLLTGRSRRILLVHAGGWSTTTSWARHRWRRWETHTVHHWSPAVAGWTVVVAARLNHKTPQQRPAKSSRRGDGLEVNCSDSVNLAGDRKDPFTGCLIADIWPPLSFSLS